jgi:hypothetical protein
MSNVLPFRSTRRSRPNGYALGPRARVESKRAIRSKVVSDRVHLQVLQDGSQRPLTRGECAGGERPCPFVSCKYNLFLDVTDSEGLKFNFPNLEPDEVPPEKSCALDIADQGGATLEDVAVTMNVTRERVRQVEEKAIQLLRLRSRNRGTAAKVLAEFSEAPADAVIGTRGNGSGSVFAPKAEPVEREPVEVEEPPTRISFFAEPDSEDVDVLVAKKVWDIFARDSNGRGFSCRSRQSIASSKVMARRRAAAGIVPKAPTHVEEDGMAKSNEDGLNEREQVFMQTYRALQQKLGRLPANPEIADAITAPWANEDTVRKVRKDLVKRGLAENRPRGGKLNGPPKRDSAPVPRARAPRLLPAPAAAPARPARTTSRDPVVAALIAKRDDLRKKADALDVAIEALSVAL